MNVADETRGMTDVARTPVALTREHMGWVAAVRWKRYRHVDMDLGDDLIGAGMIGLVQAARSYDGRGAFSSWAYLRIHGAMQDFLRCEYGRDGRPKVAAMAVGDEAILGLMAGAAPEDDHALRLTLRDEIARLPTRQRFVILARQDGGLLREIGEALGVTESRAHQLDALARATLRERLAA